MIDSFSNVLKNSISVQKTDQLLVAISGGVDSVVLADLLIQSGCRVILAHVNFGLRGADSDADEQFVRDLAQKWQVKIEVKKVATKELKIDSGVSTQMLARDIRYEWFKELCEKYQAKLMVAHHAGDATETFLLNLIRGTGIKGLTGMQYENNGIYRPLLNYSKAELIKHAQTNNLAWREDASNASNDYKRNSLRNEVIPILKKMNPKLDDAIKRVASRLDNINDLLLDAITDYKSCWEKNEDEVLIPLNKTQNPEVLYYSFVDFGFNYDAILSLLELINKNSIGKKIVSETHELYLDRDVLRLVLLNKDYVINTLLTFGANSIPSGGIRIESVDSVDKSQVGEAVQFFDLSKFKGEMKLRNWQEGDVFKPLGMKGKQKVSDFLINNKVPLSQKKKVLVLTVDDEIAWLVGYRISDDFKVRNFTEPGIKITCQ